MVFRLLLLMVIGSTVLGQEPDWGYEPENGPRTWGQRYRDCNGRSQSPINLDERSSSFRWLPSFDWVGERNVPSSMTLFNNGETVILNGTWPSGKRPSIVLFPSGLTNVFSSGLTYVLDSIHWHFGRTNFNGTEHTLNNRRLDMEMHMVMRLAGSSNRFLDSPTQTLVYGQLFQIGLEDRTPGISRVADNLSRVREPNSRSAIRPFSIDELIAWIRMPIFSYEGSLTTPPCTEPVSWKVAGTPVGVSFQDINQFRRLTNVDGQPMGGNFRPTQPRNNRFISVE